MAYTRAWDETFPADTQLANLLGQDVRNTKADIRERVSSFGAGTHASRPTPEAVFVGVVYFETDTGLMFRWNGASWDNVTSDFFAPPGGVAGNWVVGGNLSVTGTSGLTGQLTTGNVLVNGILTIANDSSLKDSAGNIGNPFLGSSGHTWQIEFFGVGDFHLFVDGSDAGRISLF